MEKSFFSQFQQGGASGDASRRQSVAPPHESSPEPDFSESESDENEDEEKKAQRRARRLTKEVKFLRAKLIRMDDKERVARKERQKIRDEMKKNQTVLK